MSALVYRVVEVCYDRSLNPLNAYGRVTVAAVSAVADRRAAVVPRGLIESVAQLREVFVLVGDEF